MPDGFIVEMDWFPPLLPGGTSDAPTGGAAQDAELNMQRRKGMPRIEPVNHEEQTGLARELLDGVKAKLGIAPNMMKTMAQSPAVLQGYLSFDGSLSTGRLSSKVRETIALATAEINHCGYCASAHSAIGKLVGLKEDAILSARQGQASDPKVDAALKFARSIIVNRGDVPDSDLEAARSAGFDDGKIAEIVANVALNILTNYFNQVAGTEIDFPVAGPLPSR
jgi:uncharacterized peroxidase-related enzyme